MAKSIVVLYKGAEERGWEGHGGDGDRDGNRAVLWGWLAHPERSLEGQAVLPSWDKSVSGLGRTSKESADCWEALKQIPEVVWKKIEIESELVGDGSPLGPGVSPCRSASPCTGRGCATQGLPRPLSPHPDRASGD